MYQIHRQDVIEWAKEYQGPKFHAMITDTPYHLTSITKRFGKEGSAPARGDVYRRASAGFMGSRWDGGGISFDPATWAALAEHLYPGAFGMSFASPRTHHRIACAIEDAGMIIQPTYYCWLYLSGFPKATRIKGEGDFNGHRYGGQCIKPAVEPVIIFQKPYEGRPVENIVRTGAGALNIDGSRIPTENKTPFPVGTQKTGYNGGFPVNGDDPSPAARWPANFILQHSPLDNGTCHESCPVRLFDEQAGESTSTASERGNYLKGQFGGTAGEGMNKVATHQPVGYDDSGPASRMFLQADFSYEVAEQLASAEPVRYEPKVSSAERDAGLGDRPLIRVGANDGNSGRSGQRTAGDGVTPIEPPMGRNPHPCLKPISLTKYLATLLLPPAAYSPRRILVPFSGVSSEMIGAMLAGWESVTGIESNAAYAAIAEARLAWWSQWPGWGQTDVDAILAAAKGDDAGETGQMSLFGKPA